MKKIISVVLIVMMVCRGIGACGQKSDKETPPPGP